MKTGFISISSIVGEVLDDLGIEERETDEPILTRWATDAASEVTTDEQLVYKVGLWTVDNFKVECPPDFDSLVEIAYRKKCEVTRGGRQEILSKWVQTFADDCRLEMELKCGKCGEKDCKGCGRNEVVVEVDRIWELANAHLNMSNTDLFTVKGFGKGTMHSTYSTQFQLLKPAISDWFQVEKHLPNCPNMAVNWSNDVETYKIERPNIDVSFPRGEVLMAYLATKTDDAGDLMIPDHHSAIEAVKDEIIHRWLRRDYLRSRDSPMLYRAYKDAQVIAEQSIGRAKSALSIPDIKSWAEWLANSRYYKVDNALTNRYNGGRGRVSPYIKRRKNPFFD